MVKAMPETKEVSDFLESASPVLSEVEREGGEEEGGEEEGGEEEGGEEEGGEEEGGEEEGGEGGVPLSSSVLHRVEELELSRGERGEEEEEEEEGDVEKSVSSNGDYQESFQDMQVNVHKFFIGCKFLQGRRKTFRFTSCKYIQ